LPAEQALRGLGALVGLRQHRDAGIAQDQIATELRALGRDVGVDQATAGAGEVDRGLRGKLSRDRCAGR
jgi:hypothetical protein